MSVIVTVNVCKANNSYTAIVWIKPLLLCESTTI